MDYTDQYKVQAQLRRELTADETAFFPTVLGNVTSWINDKVNSVFGDVEETTRYYDGAGTRILEIDPVRDITKVALVDIDETELTIYILNEDFELRPRNEIVKQWIHKRRLVDYDEDALSYNFPYGTANIAVTGKFTSSEDATVPDDIQYLATYLVARLFSKAVIGDVKKESIEGYSREFSDFQQEDEVVTNILNKYNRDDVLL